MLEVEIVLLGVDDVPVQEIVEDEVDENYGTYFDLLFDSQEKFKRNKESVDE